MLSWVVLSDLEEQDVLNYKIYCIFIDVLYDINSNGLIVVYFVSVVDFR